MQKKVLIFAQNPIVTQSGVRNLGNWQMQFIPQENSHSFDEIMLWNSSDDMHSGELFLNFSSLQTAVAHAQNHQLDYQIIEIIESKKPKKSYAENFKNLNYN